MDSARAEESHQLMESKLNSALITKLQDFLLEPGSGFVQRPWFRPAHPGFGMISSRIRECLREGDIGNPTRKPDMEG